MEKEFQAGSINQSRYCEEEFFSISLVAFSLSVKLSFLNPLIRVFDRGPNDSPFGGFESGIKTMDFPPKALSGICPQNGFRGAIIVDSGTTKINGGIVNIITIFIAFLNAIWTELYKVRKSSNV